MAFALSHAMQQLFGTSFLCIKDFIALSKTCKANEYFWTQSMLCNWLEELLLLEFDFNGIFYVHKKEHVLKKRTYERDNLHHGVTAGTHFLFKRKLLMSHQNVGLSFNCHVEHHLLWFDDPIWVQKRKVNRYYGYWTTRDGGRMVYDINAFI